MAKTDYEVTVVSASKELTAKEKVMLKDTTDCVRLDKATDNGDVVVDVDFWAELLVKNEKSEDKEYANYVVVGKDGTRYLTGSSAFWTAFLDIYREMAGIDEPWSLKIYKMVSKKSGKTFITCSII